MRKSHTILAAIMAVGLISACGDDGPNPEVGEMCQVGGYHGCGCESGVTGSQFCNPETLSWLDCKCVGAPANDVAVTIGNLEWEGTAADSPNWAAAKESCETKSWRLPTLDELKTLYSKCDIDTAAMASCTCGENDGCTKIHDAALWSATPADCVVGDCHWAVQVTEGLIMPVVDDSPVQSLCVRDKP